MADRHRFRPARLTRAASLSDPTPARTTRYMFLTQFRSDKPFRFLRATIGDLIRPDVERFIRTRSRKSPCDASRRELGMRESKLPRNRSLTPVFEKDCGRCGSRPSARYYDDPRLLSHLELSYAVHAGRVRSRATVRSTVSITVRSSLASTGLERCMLNPA